MTPRRCSCALQVLALRGEVESVTDERYAVADLAA